MPVTSVNVSDTWEEISNIYVHDGGDWRLISNAYVREGGVWRLVFRRAFVVTYTINSNTNTSFVLRNRLLADGWDETAPVEATVNITARQGQSNSLGAFVASGSYPADSTLLINVSGSGRIQGAGGDGGNGGLGQFSGGQTDGETGGTALYVRNIATTLDNDGLVAAGGTGGDGGDGAEGPPNNPSLGGGGGGGGAGSPIGQGGNGNGGGDDGANGQLNAGGAGGDGDLSSLDGENGFGPGLGPTNARTGFAINGVSNVTVTGSGDEIGRQVN